MQPAHALAYLATIQTWSYFTILLPATAHAVAGGRLSLRRLLFVLRRQMLGLARDTALLGLAKRSLLAAMEQIRFFLCDILGVSLHLLSDIHGNILEVLLAIDGRLCFRVRAALRVAGILRRALVDSS